MLLHASCLIDGYFEGGSRLLRVLRMTTPFRDAFANERSANRARIVDASQRRSQ
jgi:hypothetical protein